jgi:hypothetical protein
MHHVDDSCRLSWSPMAMALAGSSGVKVETVADPIVETSTNWYASRQITRYCDRDPR